MPNLPLTAVRMIAVLAAVLWLPASASACEPDARSVADHYAAALGDEDGFFAVDTPIRRLGFLGPAAAEAVPRLAALAGAGDGPVPSLALWAIARIAPDHPSIDRYVAEAAERASGRPDGPRLYTVAAAAAFLARAGGGEQGATRIVDRLRDELSSRATQDSVFRRAFIAWALFEIGTPRATALAETVTRDFVGAPFPDGSLLTAIDAFEVIGPHAQLAVPLLRDIATGEHDASSIVYKNDAARALAVIGGTDAARYFSDHVETLRAALHAEPSFTRRALDWLFGSSRDAALADEIGELEELLPYAACLRGDIVDILAADGHAPEVYLSAAEFLRHVAGESGELMRQRLDEIAAGNADPAIKARAAELRAAL